MENQAYEPISDAVYLAYRAIMFPVKKSVEVVEVKKLTKKQEKELARRAKRREKAKAAKTSTSNAGKFARENPHLYDKDEVQRLRQVLIDKYGKSCMCCGADEKIVLEHIKSRFLGGTNEISNLQLLCWLCNFKKGHKQTDYRPRCNAEFN